MGAGPARVVAGARSGPSPAPSRARPRRPWPPKEGRVRRVGCLAESRRGGPRPGGEAGDGPGCGRLRLRRPGKPRSRPVAWCLRAPCHRRHHYHGARPGGREWSPRFGRGQRAALRQSRCGAATGRRPGARRSGREPRATLGPATSQDRAPGAGAHPQAEPVGLGPPTVVRLEGALAHSWAPVRRSGAEATMPKSGWRTGATGPCRKSTTHQENNGQHGHATAAVETARPAHGTCVRPAWSNRVGDHATDGEPPTVTARTATSRPDTPPSVHIAAKNPTGCGQPLAGVPWCG